MEKNLSKADVPVNIYAFLKAQKLNKPVELYCAIGDEAIDNRPYSEIVEIAREFINSHGGFEKFAEWGLYKSHLYSLSVHVILVMVKNYGKISGNIRKT